MCLLVYIVPRTENVNVGMRKPPRYLFLTRELADLLNSVFRPISAPIHVNLIRVNEVKETGFKQGSTESANDFARMLESHGITATVRRRLGADVNAACGQLRRSNLKTKEDKASDQ